jgi:hypothetical protein
MMPRFVLLERRVTSLGFKQEEAQIQETNMSDLRGNSAPGEVDFGSTGKIIAAVVVMLAIGAAGTYTYETGGFRPAHNSVVADKDLPSPSAPASRAP